MSSICPNPAYTLQNTNLLNINVVVVVGYGGCFLSRLRGLSNTARASVR